MDPATTPSRGDHQVEPRDQQAKTRTTRVAVPRSRISACRRGRRADSDGDHHACGLLITGLPGLATIGSTETRSGRLPGAAHAAPLPRFADAAFGTGPAIGSSPASTRSPRSVITAVHAEPLPRTFTRPRDWSDRAVLLWLQSGHSRSGDPVGDPLQDLNLALVQPMPTVYLIPVEGVSRRALRRGNERSAHPRPGRPHCEPTAARCSSPPGTEPDRNRPPKFKRESASKLAPAPTLKPVTDRPASRLIAPR